MIRDPSDGSVNSTTPVRNEIKGVVDNSPLENTTSGLQTGSTKPENLARLQRSREWLADYHAGKIKPSDPE